MAQMGVSLRTPTAVGASGALAALVVLFAFNWPHRQVLLFFIIPMPMWVAAALGILFDVKGAMDRSGNIAFACHLGGALYGLAYYKLGWRLSQFWPSNLALPKIPGAGPKLRVHDPEGDDAEDELGQQVDRILEKIQQQGQDSLTWKERRTLERASKQYQEKRK
jgi:FAD/FMN-containing dehydrogenase